MPWGSPADAMQKPTDFLLLLLFRVSSLALEVLGLSMGKREVPVNEFSLRDINHWRTRYYGTYSSVLALQWTVFHGGPGGLNPHCLGSNPLLSTCPLAGLPTCLPSPLPHVLGLQSMSQGSSLCKLIGGDTERKLQIVIKLLFFFFPNRKTAACYNHSNRELSIPEFPGMFAMVF